IGRGRFVFVHGTRGLRNQETFLMKQLLCGVLAVFSIETSALAQTATATGTGVSTSTSMAGSGSTSSVAITSPSNIATNTSGETTLRNIPSVFAPGLAAAGIETCLGSVSAGAGLIGWGATFGTT